MRYFGAAVVLLAGSQLLACGRQREPALAPAAAVSQDTEQPAQAIANKRCNRAQECGDIGPQADYMNRQHCMNAMLADARDKLQECPFGVKSQDLQEYLFEIQDQDCNSPMGALSSLIECRASELCLD